MNTLLLRCLDFQHRKTKTPRNRFTARLVVKRAEYLRNHEALHSFGACPCHECHQQSESPWRYDEGCGCQPCFELDLILEGGPS